LVAIKGPAYQISFVQHVVDAFYGWSFGILANFAAVRALFLFSCLASSFGWSMSPLAMLFLAVMRAPFSKSCSNIRTILYFSTHRLFHRIRPLFTIFHREHHYSFHQTALTACQESGLLEAPLEASYVTLSFVFIPGWDFVDWCMDNVLNELRHHYYDEYRNSYWSVARWLRWIQMLFHHPLAHLSELDWGGFGVDNIRFGTVSPLEGGSIYNAWHGQHHWRHNKNFGYGTLDSVYDNAGSDVSLTPVLEEYLANRGKYSVRGEPLLAKKVRDNPGKVM
jgi:hypothetical protein